MVCGTNVDETLSLLCSGARVLCTGTEIPSAISIAESSGQALQTELLRQNEFVGMFLMLLKSARLNSAFHTDSKRDVFTACCSDTVCVHNALF